jgi:hypothetical protein
MPPRSGGCENDRHCGLAENPKEGPSGTTSSEPWLLNFSDRLFTVTMRTTWSDALDGICASTRSVTVNFGADKARQVRDDLC